MDIVVLGKENGGLSETLYQNLKKEYAVTFYDGNRLYSDPKGSDIFLLHTAFLKEIVSEEGILILPHKTDFSSLTSLSPSTLILVNSQNQEMMKTLSHSGVSVASCGMAQKDTLNFASVGTEHSVVSLQRDLHLPHYHCEPMDIKLRHVRNSDPFTLLVLGAVFALLKQGDVGEEIAIV